MSGVNKVSIIVNNILRAVYAEIATDVIEGVTKVIEMSPEQLSKVLP